MNTYQPRNFAEALYTPTPNLISPPINQAASWRLEGMKSVIGEFKRPINALEIGVWYGEGSTKIWLDALIEKSSITLIDFWKPYASNRDKQDSAFDYQKMDNLTHEAFINTINVVREYEAKKDLNITIIRGSSKDYLKNFTSNTFDFIYIDGNHQYDSVKSDIVNAKRIVNQKFGIICGDDYENDPTPEILELARKNTDVDFLKEKGVNHFHPGTLLAIYEELLNGEVNRHNGFWWVYIKDGKLTKDKPKDFK